MRQPTNNTIIITGMMFFVLFLIQTSAATHAQEKTYANITDSVAESAAKWIDGKITDGEFWNALERMLSELDQNNSSENKVTAIPPFPPPPPPSPETNTMTEPVRKWIEDRTIWWSEDKITDSQFLNAVQYLNKSGYLKKSYFQQNAPNISYNMTDVDIPLENIILTEREIDKITRMSVWRFVNTEHDFDETYGVKDSIRILMRDIKRVYDPVFGQYKIPTISIQITQLSNQTGIDDYWIKHTNQTGQEIADSAYMTGYIWDNAKCSFRYADTGAITICIWDKTIIQVAIFDMYNEHYQYRNPDIKIDKTEPTMYIMDGIIKKINIAIGNDVNVISKLHNILQKNQPVSNDNIQDDSTNAPIVNSTSNTIEKNKSDQIVTENIKNTTDSRQVEDIQVSTYQQNQQQSVDLEKLLAHGVTNLLCVRDDFGIVTITGQYVNDNIPKEKADVEISFVDWDDNIVGKTTISFTEIVEFEIKRFLGHIKWDRNFSSCQIFN